MKVTTGSELAREYYETGMVAFDQVKWEMARNNLEMAVREDPDFFMANFWMYFMPSKNSKTVAEQVLKTKAKLNPAEEHLKTAFKYLVDGENEKVVEQIRMAIQLHPHDPELYKVLYIIQFQVLKDVEGTIQSLESAIEACPDFPLAYNQLGYAYMDMKEFDKAGKAFDKYLQLAPKEANPYDSKGDYFMYTDQYQKAYDSYMKAYAIDSGFTISEKKAQKALQYLSKQ